MKVITTMLRYRRDRLSGEMETLVFARDGDGYRCSIPFPDQLSDAHRLAAVALVKKMRCAPVVLVSGWLRNGEWAHTMLPRTTLKQMKRVASMIEGATFVESNEVKP